MWFTESALPPIMILAFGAAVLLYLWTTSRRALLLSTAVLLTLACGVVYMVERRIVTERERVEAAIHGVAEAFEAADPEATLHFVSPRAPFIQAVVLEAMVNMEVRVKDELRITDVNIEMLNEQTRARAHFRANGRIYVGGLGDVGRKPTRWLVTWQKEGGEWKIIDVDRLDPINGDTFPDDQILSGSPR